MKPFLLLQLRAETPVSDDEFRAFLTHGGLAEADVHRIRMEQGNLPSITLDDYSGVIVGGGAPCVSTPEDKKPDYQRVFEPWLRELLDRIVTRDFPYLGCCYGLGILVDQLGGKVNKERYGEPVHGITVEQTADAAGDPLLEGLPATFEALVGHKEAVQQLPDGMVNLVQGMDCPVQMTRYKQHIYTTQFHPESTPENFVMRINFYKHEGYFPPEDAERLISEVRQTTITVPQQLLRRFVERYQQETPR